MKKDELKRMYVDLANIYLAKSIDDGRIAGLKLSLLFVNRQTKKDLEKNIRKLVEWLKEESLH